VKLKFPKSIKQKSLLKIILLAFLSSAALVVLFFVILFILFFIYKDDISKTLLSRVNQKINGQVSFSDLSFTPFKHFPNAALVLYDLSLKESKDSDHNSLRSPVFEIDEAYVSLNIIDLFSSRINVSDITFEGGTLYLVKYRDNSINLEKAIKKKTKEEIIVQKKTTQVDTSISKTQKVDENKSNLNLQIDNMEIVDVEIRIENQLTTNKLKLYVNQLQSEFSYKNNQIISSIIFDTKVDSLIIGNNLWLNDQHIKFESSIEIETDSIFIKVKDGNFSI